MPCTWDAGVNTKFVLRLYSSNTVEKIEECAPSKEVNTNVTPVTQPTSSHVNQPTANVTPVTVAQQSSVVVQSQPTSAATQQPSTTAVQHSEQQPQQTQQPQQAPRQSFLSQNRAPRTTSVAPQPTQQVTPVVRMASPSVAQPSQQAAVAPNTAEPKKPAFFMPGPAKISATTAQSAPPQPTQQVPVNTSPTPVATTPQQESNLSPEEQVSRIVGWFCDREIMNIFLQAHFTALAGHVANVSLAIKQLENIKNNVIPAITSSGQVLQIGGTVRVIKLVCSK